MPNIKEIALNIADKSGAVAYSPAPLRAVRGYSFTFEQLQNFAEALVAELAKGNEPVGYVDYGDRVEWYGTKPLPETDLYTLPPAASQIEQETAEAIANWVKNEGWMLDEMDVEQAIRSGAWKEFKNGK